MLPDNPNDQARFFYLAILGIAIGVMVLRQYRQSLGRAMQHAAIWALIFVGVLIAIGFKDTLRQQLFNSEPQRIDDNTIVLRAADDGHFHVTLLVNDVDVRFVVDTGATSLVLSQRDADRVGIDTSSLQFIIPTITANGEVLSAPVRLGRIALDQYVDHNVRATVNGGDLDQSLLGMSYLNRYQSLRFEGDRLYLYR